MEQPTPTERAAALGWQFAHGAAMTTRQVATQMELTHSGAYRLLVRMSRAVPLYCDDSGLWRALGPRKNAP